MALKIRLKRPTWKLSWSLLVRGVLIAVALIVVTFFVGCSHYYNKYAQIVDNRLKQPLFANTAKIYAAAREVRPGQKLSAHLIAGELREAGYRADGSSQSSQMGTFQEGEQSITVRP